MKRGIVIFVLLVLSISYTSAANHSASNVFVNVGTTKTSLDSSASNFIGTHTYSSVSTLIGGEHDASEIRVYVKDGEMTLLDALKSTNKLCPKTSSSVPTAPADKSKAYHLATEINLASGKTLQKAINDGNLCGCVPNVETKTCGVTSQCESPNTVTCLSSGLWPTCTPNYVAKGTDCNTAKTNACDGAGSCIGWSGNGCGSCPFGSSSGRCTLSGNQGRSKHPAEEEHHYSSWSYSTNPQCSRDACCWWQLICINPKCAYGYDWQIKP